MPPTSQPNIPAQPDQWQYDVRALELLPRYVTPADYQQAFGVPPPPFDYSKPIKLWFDSSAAAKSPTGLYQPIAGKPGILVFDQSLGQNAPPPEWRGVTNATASQINIYDPAAKLPEGWNLGSIPVPMRELLPNEKLTWSIGAVWLIQRTDKQAPTDNGTPSTADASFTAADRAQLTDVHDWLKAWLGK